MHPAMHKLIKDILLLSPLRRRFLHVYNYYFTAAQLCFLGQCIEETRGVSGSIAEVGVAAGMTTIFLNNYMDAQEIDKTYYAIDTFSGFVAKDVEFERAHRGKKRERYSSFQVNKKTWFDASMQQNGITRVHSIEADVNEYDLASLGPLSFALLDVDLYRPMKKALKELYSVLSPGGMIVVDDCDSSNVKWDGSDQAYKEFMEELGLAPEIFHQKLGIIRK